MSRYILVLAAVSRLACAEDVALLNLRLVEGEKTVYAAGSRATKGLTVEITDELARPVPGATVSFLMPESGPSGRFDDGQRTFLAITDAQGRASVWGMQWNKTPGTVEIRITALKGKVRAGTVSTQYLSDRVTASASAGGSRKLRKYLIIAAVAAGAAGAGMAFGGGGGTATAPAAVTAPPPSVGIPTITIGRP